LFVSNYLSDTSITSTVQPTVDITLGSD